MDVTDVFYYQGDPEQNVVQKRWRPPLTHFSCPKTARGLDCPLEWCRCGPLPIFLKHFIVVDVAAARQSSLRQVTLNLLATGMMVSLKQMGTGDC